MIETLDQLAQYIRQNIPEPRALAALSIHQKSGFVQFHWHGAEFVVKKSLDVFELKQQNLLATGASMLMQLVLKKSEKNERVITAIMDSMNEAVGLMEDEHQVESGLKLLENVKAALVKLGNLNGAGKPNILKSLPNKIQYATA